MTETQRNIKRYQAALPGLRERIAAAGMLLLVSLSMVVSASFAWYTISSAPEVSMMATTVAANGNLEIALANGLVKDGQKQPNEVAIGDSSSTEGKNIVSANITWGNLINLSDRSYGLGEISLRPALLSDYNLGKNPLYGATYSQDGRVEKIEEYYRYTSYAQVGTGMDFSGKSEDLKYGVRAISSVKATAATGSAELNRLYDEAEVAFRATKEIYTGIINGTSMIPDTDVSYMDGLVELLEIFVNDMACEVLYENNISSSYSPATYGHTLNNFHQLLLKYQEVLDQEAEALMWLANMQIYSKTSSSAEYFTSIEALRGASTATLNKYGITTSTLKSLKSNKTDCANVQTAINGIASLLPIHEGGTLIYWEDVKDADGNVLVPGVGDYVSALVNINQTYVGTGDSLTKVSNLGMTAALGLLSADPIEVEIREGVLKNTEARIGSLLRDNDPDRMNPLGTRVTIELKTGHDRIMGIKVDGPRNAAVRTNAKPTYLLIQDMDYASGLQPEPTDITKKDTYGFAIDFWVRTNAENTILTLEGSPEYVEQYVKCKDINGNETQVFLATKTVEIETDGSGDTTENGAAATAESEPTDATEGESGSEDTLTETITMDVYFLTETVTETDENGNEVTKDVTYVYDVNSHVILGTYDGMKADGYDLDDPKTVRIVEGYQGENRVWLNWEDMIEEKLLAENSTTQGSGSCYVFYANPSDQARILEVLRTFTIAFLDANSSHLATAKLDVDKAYDINGKVTVPLKMVLGPEYVGQMSYTNLEGKKETEEVDMRGIISLSRSTPTWLTAVVYLDGEEIGNEHVMEKGVVEGRLNLQFGSADAITGAPDIPLQQKYRTITAVATSGTQSSDKSNNPIEFNYDNVAKEITVTLTVEGDKPANISGFFTRMIGATQGSKMESLDFDFKEQNNNISIWEKTFSLTKPGEYVLYSVIADGVEYEFPTVTDASGETVYDPDTNRVVRMAPVVKIDGLKIEDIYCTPSGGEYLTSDGSKEITVNATIAATPELAPRQVRALFIDGDGKEHTAILGNTSNTADYSNWSGTIRLTNSGTYIPDRLVIDGDQSELTEEQKRANTFVLKLGVYAEIESTGIVATMKDSTQDPPEIEGTAFTFDRDIESFALSVRMKLFDNSQTELRSRSDVELVYWKGTGTNVADRRDATLTWNEETGYYEGTLMLGTGDIGNFYFREVTIQGSKHITNARIAPSYEVLSPEPPAWDNMGEGNITASYQYAPDGSAKMYAYFTDADAATAYALIKNIHTGEVQWMRSTDPDTSGGSARFEFDIPANTVSTTGKGDYKEDCVNRHDGEWVMIAACLQNVYEAVPTDEEGVTVDVLHTVNWNETLKCPVGGMFFTEDGSIPKGADGNPVVGMDFGDSTPTIYMAPGMSNIQTEVEESIFVKVASENLHNGIVTLGKTGDTVTGTFMQSQEIPGVSVTINDWRGEPVDVNHSDEVASSISNVVLSLKHQTDDVQIPGTNTFEPANKRYGGYTFSGPTGSSADETWNLTSTDGVNYTLAAPQNLEYAGAYQVTLKYTLDDGEPDTVEVSNVFTYEVWSIKPTMTVSAVTPTTKDMPTRIRWTVNRKYGVAYRVTYELDVPQTNGVTTDDQNITVKAYAQASTTENSAYGIGNKDAGFIFPTLKFAVTGIDGASTVKFTIAKGDATSARNISIAGSNEKQTVESAVCTLGNKGTTNDLDQKITPYTYSVLSYKGHGTQTISTITIERKDANNNTVTFTVELDKPIKIINPSSQNQSK